TAAPASPALGKEPAPAPASGSLNKSPETGLTEILDELLREAPTEYQMSESSLLNAAPLLRSDSPSQTEAAPPAEKQAAAEEPAPEAPAMPLERRVNSAYRLHLDRKRGEIAKLQEAFSQNINEAVTQNREFGALLQIELNALQQ